MIQRIQNLYLFLAAICALLTFFLPYAHFYAAQELLAEYAIFGLQNVQSKSEIASGAYAVPAWSIAALTFAVCVLALSLFKKRPVQYRITRLAFLLHLTYVVYLFFAIENLAETHFGEDIRILHHVGFYLPVAALPLCFLAVRGIKKDEALVKSLDRIR